MPQLCIISGFLGLEKSSRALPHLRQLQRPRCISVDMPEKPGVDNIGLLCRSVAKIAVEPVRIARVNDWKAKWLKVPWNWPNTGSSRAGGGCRCREVTMNECVRGGKQQVSYRLMKRDNLYIMRAANKQRTTYLMSNCYIRCLQRFISCKRSTVARLFCKFDVLCNIVTFVIFADGIFHLIVNFEIVKINIDKI